MNETLSKIILESQAIEYAEFDADLNLVSTSAGLDAYLYEHRKACTGAHITEVFSELVGYDDILIGIKDGVRGPLRLENLTYTLQPRRRGTGPLVLPLYFNLQVHPYEKGLLVVVRNVSGEGNQMQQITQRRNELDLLNVRLFDDLRHANENLVKAYETTLEGWAHALEMRDVETRGHSQRVSELTVSMAHWLGIDEDLVPAYRRGALLHDIGKMGIPDRILLKSSRLTADEWAIMRLHPVYAYNLLLPIDYLNESLDIPHRHHEKWDGSGYPGGLKGEEIPLAARIFSIVDVFDALTNSRPYRPAWSLEKTQDYLSKRSGVDFDPELVKAFLKVMMHSSTNDSGGEKETQ